MVDDGHLGHPEPGARRFDDDLRSELHTFTTEAHLLEGLTAEGTQTAVSVARLKTEEHIEHPGEDGVADMAVAPGHRPRLDVPPEAGAQDVIGTGLDRRDQGRDLGEVVAVVRVAHHNDASPGLGKALPVGVPVTS